MELQYITNGMSSPEGKPRVYFSCHLKDFDTAFPMIPEDILRHVNCAVWYDPDLSAMPDQRELEEVLDEMQLVVFAVTSHFLYEKNRAREVELPLALNKCIPILPIMLENGLEGEFNKRCGMIQVVARYVTDPTATPYEEVLETFLHSVLIGDELARKVRDAFDAYVFLSYRKKDRRHAHRLMRLIHENEDFRDIAIWYDEFLVPGEGFNEAIKDAFQKSSLFAMAVTPHLEEDDNYVMKVEYPMALDRQSREESFGIIPVEMYEPEDSVDGREWRIDPENLKSHEEFKYREIRGLQDEHRLLELSSAFLEALSRIARRENDGSARHRFFIGLAYLNGIDMETDYGKALELLQSAALDKEPCMEAAEKLAEMYLRGEGVRADQGKAVYWQKLLASQYLDAYRRDHDPDSHKGFGTLYFKSLLRLSDMQRDMGKHREAMETLREALTFSEKLEEEVGIREQEHDQALLLNRMGSLCLDLSDSAGAMKYYTKACRIYERQAGEIGTHRARRDLSVSYERLGDLFRKQGDLTGAEEYYEKARGIREELVREALSFQSRRDLSAVLTKLGNLRKAGREYHEAQDFYAQALEMDKILAAELRTPQAQDDYGVSLSKAGDICKALGKLPEAADLYEQALSLFEKNKNGSASRIFLDHYAGGCEKLASARKKTGNTQEAARLYRESVACREKLYASGPVPAAAHALAAACFNAASFLKDRGLMHRAYELWDELSRERPDYQKYRDKAARFLL